MDNSQIKSLRALLNALSQDDITDKGAAIRIAAQSVGGRLRLVNLLGINQSTFTRYLQGTGHRGLRDRLLRLVSREEEAITQPFSDTQFHAMEAVGMVSATSLSFLMRIREAAGFDLSRELYENLLKELRCHNAD